MGKNNKYSIQYFHGAIFNTDEFEVKHFSSLKELAKTIHAYNTDQKHTGYFTRGKCSYRNDAGMETVDHLVIDGDSSLDNISSAPPPNDVHKVLCEHKINHIIYPSYSNSKVINRYRVLIPVSGATTDYWKHGVDHIISILQKDGVQINPVPEDYVLSQPWFITGPPDKENRYPPLVYEKGRTYKLTDKKNFEIESLTVNKRGKVVTKKYKGTPQTSFTKKEAKRNIKAGMYLHPSAVALATQKVDKKKICKLIDAGQARSVRGDRRVDSFVDKELDDIFQWLEKKVQKKHHGFTFLPVNELLGEVKPTDWLIDTILERGVTAQLFGETGSYKTFCAISWGLCIATKTKWLGKVVKQAPVFMIVGEGHKGLQKRIIAWSKNNKVCLKDVPLFYSNLPAQLTVEESAKFVAKKVRSLNSEQAAEPLVIIDTMARNFGPGDENSTKDMSAFVRHLDIYLNGYTKLIIHHTGLKDPNRGRGSSVLKAALDAEYMMKKNNGSISATLSNLKLKDDELFDPINLSLKVVEVRSDPVVTSLVIDIGEAIDVSEVELTRKDKLRKHVTNNAGKKFVVADLVKNYKDFNFGSEQSCRNAVISFQKESGFLFTAKNKSFTCSDAVNRE